MSPALNDIIDNLNNKEFLLKHRIHTTEKKSCYIVNYIPGERTDYNQYTRALVIGKDKTIKSYSFDRFFNYKEKEAAKVDFDNSYFMEKMDGTLVCAYIDEHLKFHTKRLHSDDDMNFVLKNFDGKEYPLLQIAKPYLEELQLTSDLTYAFEFIHESAKVITQYTPDQYGLYLVGARDKNNFKELQEDELDVLAYEIGAKRPRIFDLITFEREDFEGFVVRDKSTGSRVKVKNKDYLLRHNLLTETKYEDLIPIVFRNEEDEIISYFPRTEPKINDIKNATKKFIDNITEKIEYYKKEGKTKKELVGTLEKSFTSSLILSYYDSPSEVYNRLRNMATGVNGQNGQPHKVARILNLID